MSSENFDLKVSMCRGGPTGSVYSYALFLGFWDSKVGVYHGYDLGDRLCICQVHTCTVGFTRLNRFLEMEVFVSHPQARLFGVTNFPIITLSFSLIQFSSYIGKGLFN